MQRCPTSRAPPLLSLTATGTSHSGQHLWGEVSPRCTGMLSDDFLCCSVCLSALPSVQYTNGLTLLCVSAAPTWLEADAP